MGKRTHEQRARALLVGVLLPGGSLAAREWWELVGLCLHPPPSLSCVSYRAPGVTPSPRPGDALLLLLPRERSLLLCRARSVSPACPPLTDIPQSARPPLLCARTQGLPISTSKPLPASGLRMCRFVCLGCPTFQPAPLPRGFLLTLRLAPCMSLPDLPRWVTPPAALSHEPAFFTRVLLL